MFDPIKQSVLFDSIFINFILVVFIKNWNKYLNLFNFINQFCTM